MPTEVAFPILRAQPSPPTLRDVAAVFFRHKRLFRVCFFVSLIAGLVYAVLTTSYTAQMKVLVRRGRIDPAVTPAQGVAFAGQREAVTEEEMNSEAELLRNQDLLREVAGKTRLGGRRSWLSWPTGDMPEQELERAANRLAKDLEVRPVRKSQLIEITYRSSDPQLAASVLKTLGDGYLERQKQLHRPAGQQAFFEEQLKIAKRELQRTQQEYEQFIRRSGTASAAVERDLTLQKLSEWQAQDFVLVSSLAEAIRRTQSLDAKLQQLPPRRVSQIRNSDNPQLQEILKSKLLELELRRTQLLMKFQPSYRLVEEIDQQIAATKTALAAENLTPLRDEMTEDNPDYLWANSERLKASVESEVLRKRLSVAREQVAGYQSKAERLARGAVDQGDLEQRLKAAEDKYLLYAEKREQARIGDALDQNGILNVAIAQDPHVPALPSRSLWLSMCFSFFAACMVSTGAVFVVDYVDPSVRTPSEVVALLGAPVLASLAAAQERPKLRAS